MERNVVILDVDYVTHDDKPVVRLFAKMVKIMSF